MLTTAVTRSTTWPPALPPRRARARAGLLHPPGSSRYRARIPRAGARGLVTSRSIRMPRRCPPRIHARQKLAEGRRLPQDPRSANANEHVRGRARVDPLNSGVEDVQTPREQRHELSRPPPPLLFSKWASRWPRLGRRQCRPASGRGTRPHRASRSGLRLPESGCVHRVQRLLLSALELFRRIAPDRRRSSASTKVEARPSARGARVSARRSSECPSSASISCVSGPSSAPRRRDR